MPRHEVKDAQFDAFQTAADNETIAVLSAIAEGCSWESFDSIPINHFRNLRDVGIFDLWFDYSDARIAGRLGIPAAEVRDLREHERYEDVREALLESLKESKVAKPVNELLADPKRQMRIFRRQERLAASNDLKVSERANTNLFDKVSPDAHGRETNPVIVVQMSTMEKLGRVEELCEERGEFKLIGSGSTSDEQDE